MTKEIWFDGSQKPVRSGVYKRQYVTGNCYSYYCYLRNRWGFGVGIKEDAKSKFDVFGSSLLQNLPWGGLAKEPK